MTLKETVRTLRLMGFTKIGNAYANADQTRWIKRATPTQWKALDRFDRGWKIIIIETTLNDVINEIRKYEQTTVDHRLDIELKETT